MNFIAPLKNKDCILEKSRTIKQLRKIIAHLNFSLIFFPLTLLAILMMMGAGVTAESHHRADWLYASKWGVFTHYLAEPNMSASDWNSRVRNFDVEGLALQLKSVGAKYYFITLGQNSGHYCSPNASYDRLVGVQPSKCSSRDLVSDLYKALKPYDIKLLVYLPSAAPSQDSTAVEKLKWLNGPHRNQEFQNQWEAVIREWSLRWGHKVQGWWFDGCYWPKAMYEFADSPNFKTFAAAARAGNPNSILAFNPGVIYPIISSNENEDYSAGEINEPWGVECDGRWIGKTQYHVISYLGSKWGGGDLRYTDKEVIRITNNITKCGGVITWDVPILENGHIPQSFINQLAQLNQGLKQPLKPVRIVAEPPGNLASHKKAKMLDLSGKRSLSVNSAKYFAQLGVDGDFRTYALPGGEWAWTYQVDLGRINQVRSIKITFGSLFATQYQILLSRDGMKWFEVAQENDSNGGKHRYTFNRINARYVRVKGIKPDGVNQKGGQMSISELEVYQ
jgi:hypothetical protein